MKKKIFVLVVLLSVGYGFSNQFPLDRFHICTVLNKKSSKADKLLDSCKRNGLYC